MKKIMYLVSALLIALAVAACTPSTVPERVTITIFHTNDIHGRFESAGASMGIDTIAAIYAWRENAILVDAGDTVHGLPFVNLSKGGNAVELMNMAGYSLMVPGNHEFNFGWERLVELGEMADFPFIAANVIKDGQPLFQPYHIITVAGIRLGFFGLATPDTPVTTHPNSVIGIDFTDPVEASRRSVAALQAAGVDVVIALAHLGFDPDNYSGNEWPLRIAAQVSGIDLFIDGHSHTLIPYGHLVNDVLIVQAGEHGQWLGMVEIEFIDGEVYNMTASLIHRDYAFENFTPQANITAAIERMNEGLDLVFAEVVGYTPVTLYGDGGGHRENLRAREVPIGNLIADAMRWATDADMTLLNSGGIRCHFHAGDITIGDVIRVLAFPNYVVVKEISPAQLREALENGVSFMPVASGRFPQVSGFSFTFDPAREVGDRVLGISVDGQALNLDDTATTFTIAINDFKAAGGDGYTTFVGLTQVGQAGLESEVFIDYLAATDLNTRNLGLEGRIVNVGAAQ